MFKDNIPQEKTTVDRYIVLQNSLLTNQHELENINVCEKLPENERNELIVRLQCKIRKIQEEIITMK